MPERSENDQETNPRRPQKDHQTFGVVCVALGIEFGGLWSREGVVVQEPIAIAILCVFLCLLLLWVRSITVTTAIYQGLYY